MPVFGAFIEDSQGAVVGLLSVPLFAPQSPDIALAMTDLDEKALSRNLALFAAIAALIFIAAGTLDYWQAWIFLGVFSGSSLAITLYLMRFDRRLLELRMRGGPRTETRRTQKIVMWLVSLTFVLLLVVPALDHRFHWSTMPPFVTFIGGALIVLGYIATFFVFRENSFAAVTVQIDPNQKVVSTGPYALMRHPMYAGGLLLLIGVPLALASWWGLLVLLLLLPALLWRLLDEEQLLTNSLPGYAAYKAKVKYRLIPFVW
jgi:protein-S-isoprenylcysteine O-methyltransferase Ste14